MGAQGAELPHGTRIRSVSPAYEWILNHTGPPGTSQDFHLKRLLPGECPLLSDLCRRQTHILFGRTYISRAWWKAPQQAMSWCGNTTECVRKQGPRSQRPGPAPGDHGLEPSGHRAEDHRGYPSF